MSADCLEEIENRLITAEMIVEAIYSALESHRPRWRELETQSLNLAAVHPKVMEGPL